MAVPQKSIRLLLYGNDLDGVVCIDDSVWNAGELYSAPRESLSDLFSIEAFNKFGVYLLISEKQVYIGQSQDISQRITQHHLTKDWWDRVVILTTDNNWLDHADIDYLETTLIAEAKKSDTYSCDNKNDGNALKVDKFRKVKLDQYLEEAVFLMQLIGIDVFKTNKKKISLNLLSEKEKLKIGKNAKSEAISFLGKNGIVLDKKSTYAVKQPLREEFWINPKKNLLNKDWTLILNDTVNQELIVLKVPPKSLTVKSPDCDGVLTRSDKKELLDLNINTKTLIDRKSSIDFSSYEKHRVSYK